MFFCEYYHAKKQFNFRTPTHGTAPQKEVEKLERIKEGIPLTSTKYDADILTAPWMGENFGYREIVFRTVRAIEVLNASERAILR